MIMACLIPTLPLVAFPKEGIDWNMGNQEEGFSLFQGNLEYLT